MPFIGVVTSFANRAIRNFFTLIQSDVSQIVWVTSFSSKEIIMSDENINPMSSDHKSDQVKGNLMVAGVTILGASALVIAFMAGFS